MDSTIWNAPSFSVSEKDVDPLTPARSLYKTFQRMPEPRRGQGRRYEVALLLCLLVVAKLAGQTTLCGATEWIRHRADLIATHLGLSRKQMPCQMTYCRLLARLDVQLLDELLAAFFIRWEA
jgi:hypothetical protein